MPLASHSPPSFGDPIRTGAPCSKDVLYNDCVSLQGAYSGHGEQAESGLAPNAVLLENESATADVERQSPGETKNEKTKLATRNSRPIRSYAPIHFHS